MEKVSLNKSSLKKIKDKQSLYEKYLPTLELKKKQLQIEVKKAENELLDKYREIFEYRAKVSEWAALIVVDSTVISKLIEITKVETRVESQIGIKVDVLENIEFDIKPYSVIASHPWMDELVFSMKRILTLEVEEELKRRKLLVMKKEFLKITQRINLFEKVMIPKCKEDIKKIKIYLGDNETASVCRSKLAKKKLAQTR